MADLSFLGVLTKAASTNSPPSYFTGTITAITGRNLTVSIVGSGSVVVKTVGATIPAIGKKVLVLRTEMGELFALGEI